jgi:hypothetical protein
VLAFVPLALVSRKERDADAAYRYPRFDVFRVGPLRTILTSRLLLGGLRLLFVILLVVALIVAGHMIAVYLAHAISLRLLRDPGRVFRSQLSMLVLMVLYAITSLWILAQPIVK